MSTGQIIGQMQEGVEGKDEVVGSASSARPINCDQVAWMLGAIGRYLPNDSSVSRSKEMQKYALLYELMEVANLYFEDDGAAYNGTPPDVQRFRYTSKRGSVKASLNKAEVKGLHDA